jgi:D-Tyr-tRNAtyr deacylase
MLRSPQQTIIAKLSSGNLILLGVSSDEFPIVFAANRVPQKLLDIRIHKDLDMKFETEISPEFPT